MENIIYFFRNIPEYSNFTIFGITHIGILLTAIIGSILLIKRMKVCRKTEKFIGSILLFQQAILYTWYISSGYNTLIEGLPLYHCRIAILLVGLGLIFKKDLFKKLGSILGIIGSIVALAYPGLDPFLFPHITQFSFFIGHLFLLWGSIYCLFIERVTISECDYNKIAMFTNTYHISMFVLNHILGSNYGYMRKSPIGIGDNLPPVIYGAIVICLFNILLSKICPMISNSIIDDNDTLERKDTSNDKDNLNEIYI